MFEINCEIIGYTHDQESTTHRNREHGSQAQQRYMVWFGREVKQQEIDGLQ